MELLEHRHIELKSVYRPEYSVFQLSVEDLQTARDLAGRGIILANWLAFKARNELPCFREFIYWLRYGALFLQFFEWLRPDRDRGDQYCVAK